MHIRSIILGGAAAIALVAGTSAFAADPMTPAQTEAGVNHTDASTAGTAMKPAATSSGTSASMTMTMHTGGHHHWHHWRHHRWHHHHWHHHHMTAAHSATPPASTPAKP